jgi:hypothetical protein
MLKVARALVSEVELEIGVGAGAGAGAVKAGAVEAGANEAGVVGVHYLYSNILMGECTFIVIVVVSSIFLVFLSKNVAGFQNRRPL